MPSSDDAVNSSRPGPLEQPISYTAAVAAVNVPLDRQRWARALIQLVREPWVYRGRNVGTARRRNRGALFKLLI
jgi:hypothetical protein